MVIVAQEKTYGAWAFLIGVILAVIIGLSTSLAFTTVFPGIGNISTISSQVYAVLVILGLIIGFFMNVSGKDAQTFLIAGTVLVVVSKFGMESVSGSLIGIGVGDMVTSVFGAMLALFVPATIIVALKTVFNIARV